MASQEATNLPKIEVEREIENPYTTRDTPTGRYYGGYSYFIDGKKSNRQAYEDACKLHGIKPIKEEPPHTVMI